jgi:hypothetical protein
MRKGGRWGGWGADAARARRGGRGEREREREKVWGEEWRLCGAGFVAAPLSACGEARSTGRK